MTTTKPSDQPSKHTKQETRDLNFDMSDPEEFKRAFIASEILNRKY